MLIREYGSTLYVGMAWKKNGRPYISIASDELKSLVIYRNKFYNTHTFSYLVVLWLPKPSRWPKIVVNIENRQVAKLAKCSSYYTYYFPDKSFFCCWTITIPIAFIVKFWCTSIEMISSSTMKEESFEDYRDNISNWTPFLWVFFNAHAHSWFKLLCESLCWTSKCWNHNKICEEIHSYNKTY